MPPRRILALSRRGGPGHSGRAPAPASVSVPASVSAFVSVSGFAPAPGCEQDGPP
ncbi:hypothetical protein SSCG_05298 [Streptomyces clavuligerus]|nr:hypothetical protein SSCG_05298 [Streptomyces clavuligerus]